MKILPIYIGILFLLFGCKKEVGPQSVNPDKKGTGKLIVINEGNFGFGNASVSLLNPETGEIANNQYRAVNRVGIGDVLQSVTRHDNKFYFVVNNSGKVVVTDTNLKLITEITGFNSPRYIEFYGNKGFVTDLKQEAVYVIDVATNQITNEIPTQGWTEDIVPSGNELLVLDRGDYLTNSDSNWVYRINPQSETKIDSLIVGTNPNSMQLDGNGHLWVLTSGKVGIENPSLTQYNRVGQSILFQYVFPSSGNFPTRLRFSPADNRLYFINNSLYSIATNGSQNSPSLFYSAQAQNLYGLSIIQDKVYATDAKNFNQTGNVHIFGLDGTTYFKLGCGLIPSRVY